MGTSIDIVVIVGIRIERMRNCEIIALVHDVT